METYFIAIFILTLTFIVTGHNFDHKNEMHNSGHRIVGGRNASAGELPFQVSVHWSIYSGSRIFNHVCGGSIIDNEHVLTAAHCVKGKSAIDLLVVAGVLNIESSEENKVVREVTEVFVHEKYKRDSAIDDIALLKVSPGFPTDNPAVKPIPLRKEAARDEVTCTVSGWGLHGENDKNQPDILQVAHLYFISYEECRSRYENNTKRSIEPGMICAGPIGKILDSCYGDSGGPLQCGGLLTGVVSWGEGCASPIYPGVYTDVTYYKEWIEEHLRKGKVEL